MEVRDRNGDILNEGDSIKVIKDLKINGSPLVVKRGTIVKKIHLATDQEIDCCLEGKNLKLEARWLQKIQ